MRWGLVPRWAKDVKIGYSTFNARADTIASKPAFRDAWKEGRRCLVVTNGFYEWRKSDKQPFAVAMADDDLMVIAGLWDEWVSPARERIKSCTVIRTEPNDAVGPLHDRMPFILEEKDWPRWLGEEPTT
jgi:putative SOS response-associated peptidase YedK